MITQQTNPQTDAPAGSGGWKAHAEAMERERDYYRNRCELMYRYSEKDCWYWQGQDDNLESMVGSLPVVIRADQLRELLPQLAVKAKTVPSITGQLWDALISIPGARRRIWNNVLDEETRGCYN